MKKAASSASENGELRNAKRLVAISKEACCEEEKGLLDLLTYLWNDVYPQHTEKKGEFPSTPSKRPLTDCKSSCNGWKEAAFLASTLPPIRLLGVRCFLLRKTMFSSLQNYVLRGVKLYISFVNIPVEGVEGENQCSFHPLNAMNQ